jgi:crotonobetainyl-CoA:carnitine CoA-transferase CaiB-like acyl-CoA transferase
MFMTISPTPAPEKPAPGAPPLEGIRVLDLSTFLAAPVAATLLAEFGAEVIKVEDPGAGDFPRWHAGRPGGRTPQWAQEGRNKSSVTLDLRTAEGQSLARDLAARCDVVVTNFRPATATRWRLTAEDLIATDPQLIVLSITGFGLTGPYRDRGSFDRIASAFSGHSFVSGFPDRPPVRSGFATIDYLGAYAGAFGIMAALRARDAGQGGQVIDLALAEVALRATEAAPAEYAYTGRVRQRVGNRNSKVVPASEATSADGRDVAYHAGTAALFARLTRAIGRPDLADDDRFASHALRIENQDALYEIVADWIGERCSADIVDTLNAAGIPASTVNNTADVLADRHLCERGAFEVVEDSELGTLPVVTPVPRLSQTPGRTRHLGPALGSGNAEVLGGLLGLSGAEIEDLRLRGVI